MCMYIGAGWKRPTGPEVIDYDNITGDIPKTVIWADLGLWRPVEANLNENGAKNGTVCRRHPASQVARATRGKRHRHQAPQAQAPQAPSDTELVQKESSWPERSEGHERSPAGASDRCLYARCR